jgi:hypothetical protein
LLIVRSLLPAGEPYHPDEHFGRYDIPPFSRISTLT